jgi:hypothetical protein
MPTLRTLIGCYFAVCAAVAVALPSIDPDLFWHLGVGRAALAGEAITVEPWSWVAGGRPFFPHSIAHDALLALLYDGGGLIAVSLLGALLGWAALLLLDRLTRLVVGADPVLRGAVLLIAALLAAPVWSARAQLYDLLGLLVTLLLLERVRRGGTPRLLLLLPPIAFAWSFLHGAGLLAGASVVAVYLLERLIARDWRGAATLLLSGLAAAVASLFTPLGPSLLLYPVETLISPIQQAVIAEWQPLSIELPSGALLVGLLLVFIAFRLRPSTPRPIVLLALAYGLMAAGSVRALLLAGPLVALLLVPSIAAAIERIATELLRRRGASLAATGLMRGGVVVVLLATAAFGALRLAGSGNPARLAADYPVAAAAALRDEGCTANAVNSYGFGGYLIEATDLVVGHYGAADAFGDPLLADYVTYVSTLRADPAPYLAANKVELAVLPLESALTTHLVATGWSEWFADPTAVVLVAPGADCRR